MSLLFHKQLKQLDAVPEEEKKEMVDTYTAAYKQVGKDNYGGTLTVEKLSMFLSEHCCYCERHREQFDEIATLLMRKRETLKKNDKVSLSEKTLLYLKKGLCRDSNGTECSFGNGSLKRDIGE